MKPKKNAGKEIRGWAVMLLPNKIQPCILFYTKGRAEQLARAWNLTVKRCRIILD